MSAEWRKWTRYAKARLDAALASGHEELDKREARLEAERAGKPWIGTGGDGPSFDDIKARIEHESRPVPTPPGAEPGPGDAAAEAATRERAGREAEAEKRLAAIRRELGLDDEAH